MTNITRVAGAEIAMNEHKYQSLNSLDFSCR